MANQRELSRQDWTSQQNSLEAINSGSLQRIADATELMAKDRLQMEKDLEFYKRRYREQGEYIGSLHRSQTAYKAHITRLRNKLEAETNARYEQLNQAKVRRELEKAIAQFTGWNYRPSYDAAELAQLMGLTSDEYTEIREDLSNFLREKDIAELDTIFAPEATKA